MRIQEISRDSNGTFPAYTWPGGYPMVYMDSDGSWLCADCATKSFNDPDELPTFKPIAGEVYWEGSDSRCDGCNAVIESAYGDPERKDMAHNVGDKVVYDSFAGPIRCKVLAVTVRNPDMDWRDYTLKVTSRKNRVYPLGHVFETSSLHVFKRVLVRGGRYYVTNRDAVTSWRPEYVSEQEIG